LNHYYNAVEESDPPVRWKVLSNPSLQVKANRIPMVSECWNRGDLFSLHNSLIAAVARSDGMGHDEAPCPINFTEQKLLQHQSEMEMLEGISTILRQLQEDVFILLGGMGRLEYYERAMELNNYFRQEFINLTENEHQRELHAKFWPYQ